MTTVEALLGKLSDPALQVLELVARGRSNLAIGQVPRRSRHVHSLFTKLKLEQRLKEHRRVMAR